MQAQSTYFVQPLDSHCAVTPAQTMCSMLLLKIYWLRFFFMANQILLI